MDQPSVSAIEEDAPLSPEPWYQQELGSLDQEDQQTSLLLQVKEEEEEQETCRQGQVEVLCMHNFPFTACTNLSTTGILFSFSPSESS